jgi:hypothetical protein
MQLCYRGVSYEYNPTPVDTIQGEVAGKYRGLPWRYTYVNMKQGLKQKTFDLYYRGVTPRRQKSKKAPGILAPEPNF